MLKIVEKKKGNSKKGIHHLKKKNPKTEMKYQKRNTTNEENNTTNEENNLAIKRKISRSGDHNRKK